MHSKMHRNIFIFLVLLLPSSLIVLADHEHELDDELDELDGHEKQSICREHSKLIIGENIGVILDRICVPDQDYDICLEMVEAGKSRMGRIRCFHAPDKVSCMEKILKGEVDFMPLESEEIYLADRLNPRGFLIFGEIRSGDYHTRDFRYESVAVVRTSSGITSIANLKGKRPCHTGYGRNSGWRIPFSHLMDKRELSPYCDKLNASNIERDLYAVSNYFEAACAPGSWAPDKETDKRLKKTYPNLCALCKDPSKCSKKDEYGKYDGALRCLTQNDGDVAWTKLDAVEEFFKLRENSSLEIATEYQFLRGDDTTLPLTTETPCSWAKRPWKAFITSRRIGKDANQIKDLRDQLTLALYSGAKELSPTPDWLPSVFEFKPTDEAYFYNPYRVKTVTPSVYLKQRNFTLTFEKPSCPAHNPVRFCVRNEIEMLKCNALRIASESQRISPGFHCVSGRGLIDCIRKASKRQGLADVAVLPYREIDNAQGFCQLVPILSEVEKVDHEKTETFRYAVAVIRAQLSGEFTSISNLRGRPSCHGSINSIAGWNAPLSVLVEAGEINVRGVLEREMARYFGNKTCVPGAKDEALCSLCAGDGGPGSGKAHTLETVCADDDTERYYGGVGALQCLQDNVADIAFLDHVALNLCTKNRERHDLNPENIRLLCRDGTVAELDQFEDCNWGTVASQRVMAREGDDENSVLEREDTKLSLLEAQNLFGTGGKAERVFKLFGSYYKNENLLFQDTSVGLAALSNPEN